MTSEEATINKIKGLYVMDALHSFRKPASFTKILNFIAKNLGTDPDSIKEEIMVTIQNGVNFGFIFQNEADDFFIFRKRIMNELLAMDQARAASNDQTMDVETKTETNEPLNKSHVSASTSVSVKVAESSATSPSDCPSNPSNASSIVSVSSAQSADSAGLNTDELEFLAELSGDSCASDEVAPPAQKPKRGRPPKKQQESKRERSRSNTTRPEPKK